jgi:methylphosphotriester-DNA--protein-cysteine methyltransferase
MIDVSSANTISFRDRNAAVRQGYRPCKACKP